MGESNFTGAINPGSRGDISLMELIQQIERHVSKSAITTTQVTRENASPFGLEGSWSINTEKAEKLGFTFSELNESLKNIIQFYYADSN